MTIRKVIILISAASFLLFHEIAGFCGSPYSADGLGTIINDNAGRSLGMGGVGVADDDGGYLLRGNPALIGGAQKNSFALSLIYSRTNTNMGNNGDFLYAKTTPNILKIILPINRNITLGWGLSPYSRTDINLHFEGVQDSILTKDTLTSTGGINVSSTSIAYSFRNRIRVGFSFNYNFGMINENWQRSFPSDSLLTSSYYQLKRKFGGYNQSVGILAKVTERLSLGAGYTNKSELNQRYVVHTGTNNDPDKILTTITTVLPETWCAGMMMKITDKYAVGSDVSFEGWEKAARTEKEKEYYNDTFRVGAGFRYNPVPKITDSYFKKIPLSIGFSYGTLYYKSYPIIDTVTENSVSLGIEFPLRNNAGSILTSLQYGKRGEKSKNGWDENFMSFGITFLGRMQ